MFNYNILINTFKKNKLKIYLINLSFLSLIESWIIAIQKTDIIVINCKCKVKSKLYLLY